MKKSVLFLAVSILLSVLSFNTYALENSSLYIYVDGKTEQSGDGSFEFPFKTVGEAKEKIIGIKNAQGYPEGGIVVSIRGGEYSMLDGLKFSKEDSGTEKEPVVYRAYGNEEVRFIGGNEVSFSNFELVEDSSILSRLDSSVAGKLYKLDLDENGIKPYDEFGINGLQYNDGTGAYTSNDGSAYGLTYYTVTDGKGIMEKKGSRTAYEKMSWEADFSSQALAYRSLFFLH